MDQQMALTWSLLYMALLALCWKPGATEAQDTIPLQTLSCYNDYSSHIICSWADLEDAQDLINMTLYRKLGKDYPVSCSLSDDLVWSECPSAHRCVPRRCVIAYTGFSITDEDYYSFQPDQDVGIQLVVPLAQHVQPPPPKDINISPSGDHFLLKWNWTLGDAQVPWLSQEDVEFEVAYKRLQDTWEDALRLNTSDLWVSLASELFLPSNIYVARVRTQLSPGSSWSGRPSRWSPEVQWNAQPVQMHPPSLKVTKNGDSYNLRWETKKLLYSHIQHKFQVQYKKKLDSWEDSKTEILDHAHSMSLPRLVPSTSYSARVRVKPLPEYYGIWSEWSEECTWTTDWVMPTWGIVLILIVLILILILALRFGCAYGCRLYRKWKEKIPNPSKSLLFRDGGKGLWSPSSTAAFATKNLTPRGPQRNFFTELQGMSHSHTVDNEVSPLTIEVPKIVQDLPSGPDPTSSEPTEQLSDGQRDPQTHFGKPESQKPNFDFNGPYLGPPKTHSLTNLQGQLVPPEISGSLKPELPHSLEYLCLPPGGQVQLVPLSQAMSKGQAMDAERESSLKTTESPSVEQRDSPSLDLRVEEQEPKDNAVTLSLNSGGTEDPVVASGYVTPADLVLTLPTGPPSTSLGLSLGLPSAQGPSLCLTLPGVPPGSPALPAPELDDYVELPPSISQPPKIPLGNPVPPVPSSTAVNPGEHREEVAPTSPHHEGLLVLQQVGDYCFLPGLAPGSLSPHSKPPSPGLCLEMVDLDQDLSVKKPSCQPMPQVPAIQFFKSLKHQDYLSLPPWDSSQPGKVC
ncbi:cytokine receptor common subunit beta isoform X4 [Alexandromys fortis]|uniref:cytokine receptor common subunit beta isoform X4 n=1 Tax=Alexandromys fortis TaxID=100897 RepID=UPI002153746B|nr:cytokine receptor common subunit beta isoform X4 [Microtus fortis]